MDIRTLLVSIGSTIVVALITWALGLLTNWLKTKIKNKKILELLTSIINIVTNAVKATYQTYVENIKDTTEWDAAAQKKALEMALETAKSQLSEEAIKLIEEKYGDLDFYLTNLIESILYDLKK